MDINRRIREFGAQALYGSNGADGRNRPADPYSAAAAAPATRLRLSDVDRSNALQHLSTHYADGRLDHAEFDDRTRLVVEAVNTDDLAPLFADLPGGLPVDRDGLPLPVGADADANIGASADERTGHGTRASTAAAPAADDAEDRDLGRIRRRGSFVKTADWVFFLVALVSYFILENVLEASYAGIAWALLLISYPAVRWLSGLSSDDEKTYDELKKIDEADRRERVRRAAARRHELGH
ncbi:DUF1707 SHOCT-like domain-containing protein [Corynebacterium sp. 335C]